jgi:hypothetical protein
VAIEPPHAARVSEVRQEEGAVGHERDTIGADVFMGSRQPGLLRSICADMRDAATPIGDEDVSRRQGEDAFGPMEIVPNRFEPRDGHRTLR